MPATVRPSIVAPASSVPASRARPNARASRVLSSSLAVALVTFVLPPTVAAQRPARLALLDDWHHQQKHILAVIDSATPEMLDFRTTKGVRTFAEQIHHIVTVAAVIVGQAVTERALPGTVPGDTAVYLHDKAQLRAVADRYLGFVIGSLEAMTDEALDAEKAFAGGSMTKWRWNVTALQHSAWTLGQLVPYLRMNGRTPPQFTPF